MQSYLHIFLTTPNSSLQAFAAILAPLLLFGVLVFLMWLQEHEDRHSWLQPITFILIIVIVTFGVTGTGVLLKNTFGILGAAFIIIAYIVAYVKLGDKVSDMLRSIVRKVRSVKTPSI
ncbi:hypothetical protein FWD07_02375 [Candidatus Saccharibacteria bacterium]|nr:hypothetical protein [Candidatus Saccharibacteria bacterium]